MPKSVVARAPGKVIISGEHFVVSGSPAIAAAIDLYATAKVLEVSSGPSVIYAEDLGIRMALGADPPQELRPLISVINALKGLDYDIPRFEAHIRSSVPASAGLGSSAAIGAAFAMALSALAGDRLSREQLFSVTMEGERVAHGNPSGVDPAAVVNGGVILYRKGLGVIDRVEGIGGLSLIVADSGVRRSTGAAVSSVLRLLEALGDLRSSLLATAEGVVKAAWSSIVERRADVLGAMLNVNHGLLAAIGVSTPELDELVHTARRSGALGAKLTGAGWGGSIIAVALPDAVGPVVKSLAVKSRWVREVRVSEAGVELVEW